jgi:hypothetical protein
LDFRRDHARPEAVLVGDAARLDLAHDDVLAARRQADPAVEMTEHERRQPGDKGDDRDHHGEPVDAPLVHDLDSSRGSWRADVREIPEAASGNERLAGARSRSHDRAAI